ncbi:MAG: class I SAM-dependent methyltransferase [Chromatiales bacterium]|jgi:ubiquinone/menaquinone biosynthesis C-methylase UbiE|nr:class I SAM-dependent methyltransferase [Chromatiales bacterium]
MNQHKNESGLANPADIATNDTMASNAMGGDWEGVAHGWEKWRETMESGTATVTDRLLEMVEIRPGWRVLDLACGIGQPALTAAERVGPTGKVVAIDHTAGMLELAKRQAHTLDLHNIDFICSDASELGNVSGRFDAVLCRWGLMFLPDPADTLVRILEALEPGRRFAAAVWSAPERVPSINLPFDVASELFGTLRMRAGGPGPFRFADSAALLRSFSAAGFHQVFMEYLTVPFEASSSAAYIELSQDLNAQLAALLAQQSAPQRAHFWEALHDAAGRYALPDGRVRFWNEAVCITGMR